MTQSSGYMFTAKLTAGPVNNNGTIVINTPDASNPSVDKVNWEVAANGYVYVDPAVTVGWGANFINVTNRTGIPWPQHSEVVLCAPRLSDEVDLTPRVAALETTVATHTTQIASHETRIAALETAAP